MTLSKAIKCFTSLQAWQLKRFALLTGCAAGTTKASIADGLAQIINQSQAVSRNERILSIDMGIKNLAFCLLEPYPRMSKSDLSSKSAKKSEAPADQKRFKIHAWQRLNILIPPSSTSDPGTLPDLDRSTVSDTDPDKIPANTFTPSQLAPLAVRLAQTFLSHNPSTIIIERQRFRSSRGSAVQEWTLRVNTLEAMLWACFETLKSGHQHLHQHQRGHILQQQDDFPLVKEVSPQRIASFWNARKLGPELEPGPVVDIYAGIKSEEGSETLVRGMEKKEKIKLVTRWVGEGWIDGVEGMEEQMDVFAEAKGRRKTKGEGKRDDLADCLVQGVTWALWEENRKILGDLVSEDGGSSGAVHKSVPKISSKKTQRKDLPP